MGIPGSWKKQKSLRARWPCNHSAVVTAIKIWLCFQCRLALHLQPVATGTCKDQSNSIVLITETLSPHQYSKYSFCPRLHRVCNTGSKGWFYWDLIQTRDNLCLVESTVVRIHFLILVMAAMLIMRNLIKHQWSRFMEAWIFAVNISLHC